MCQINNAPFVVTLVASDTPLTDDHVASAHAILGKGEVDWVSRGKAVDVYSNLTSSRRRPGSLDEKNEQDPGLHRDDKQAFINQLRKILDPHRIDVFITPTENRKKSLLIADMDSTIVQGETLDDLAAHVGVKDEVAAITTRAMRGELDFEAALNARLALLKGLSEDVIHDAVTKMKYNAGAQSLVKSMKQNDAYCYLVSGGFTQFTSHAAQVLGFDGHHGNVFGIANKALTGTYTPPLQTKDSKVAHLTHYMKHHNVHPFEVMCIGDGANDIPMLLAAENGGGLGIAYHAKPKVVEAVTNAIRFGDLGTALYAQGYKDTAQ